MSAGEKEGLILFLNEAICSKNRTQPWEEALRGRVLGSRQAWGSGEICSRRKDKELVGRERRALCRWWGPEMARSREVSLVFSVPCLPDSARLPAFLLISSPPHLPHLPSCSLHLSLVGSPGRLPRGDSEAALGTQLSLGSCGAFCG